MIKVIFYRKCVSDIQLSKRIKENESIQVNEI